MLVGECQCIEAVVFGAQNYHLRRLVRLFLHPGEHFQHHFGILGEPWGTTGAAGKTFEVGRQIWILAISVDDYGAPFYIVLGTEALFFSRARFQVLFSYRFRNVNSDSRGSETRSSYGKYCKNKVFASVSKVMVLA